MLRKGVLIQKFCCFRNKMYWILLNLHCGLFLEVLFDLQWLYYFSEACLYKAIKMRHFFESLIFCKLEIITRSSKIIPSSHLREVCCGVSGDHIQDWKRVAAVARIPSLLKVSRWAVGFTSWVWLPCLPQSQDSILFSLLLKLLWWALETELALHRRIRSLG